MEPGFSSASVDACGHCVCLSGHYGYALTWKILTLNTDKVITGSVFYPADKDNPHICALSFSLWRIIANSASTLKSHQEGDTIQNEDQPTTSPKDISTNTPLIDTEDLIGHFVSSL
jgi:hypothetical protein